MHPNAASYKNESYAQRTLVLIEAFKTQNAALQTGNAADHASLLTLQAQMARLLGEGAQAAK